MANIIPLNKILVALDNKDRDFYDNLSPELKKKFSAFLLVRYCSSVVSNSDLENYYIASTNHYVNKHLFDLSKHPKLQWLTMTAASPGIGVCKHQWIKMKSKNTDNSVKKELMKYFPTMKDEDIDVLSTMVTKRELTAYAKEFGEK